MRDRQVGLGAVLAPQCRNATPPLVTASAAHALRHALTYPAIPDMPIRQCTPSADLTPPIQAARARNTRVQEAIDTPKGLRNVVGLRPPRPEITGRRIIRASAPTNRPFLCPS